MEGPCSIELHPFCASSARTANLLSDEALLPFRRHLVGASPPHPQGVSLTQGPRQEAESPTAGCASAVSPPSPSTEYPQRVARKHYACSFSIRTTRHCGQRTSFGPKRVSLTFSAGTTGAIHTQSKRRRQRRQFPWLALLYCHPSPRPPLNSPDRSLALRGASCRR